MDVIKNVELNPLPVMPGSFLAKHTRILGVRDDSKTLLQKSCKIKRFCLFFLFFALSKINAFKLLHLPKDGPLKRHCVPQAKLSV